MKQTDKDLVVLKMVRFFSFMTALVSSFGLMVKVLGDYFAADFAKGLATFIPDKWAIGLTVGLVMSLVFIAFMWAYP